MKKTPNISVDLVPYSQIGNNAALDLDQIIYDLESQIELLTSQSDSIDYLVSISSGVLCGMLDVLWVGEFSLDRGRDIAADKVEDFVKKAARLTGCESDDIAKAVKHLEKLFPIPSDGNTPDFGGGLQHHLRDFAHHPTIVGLMFRPAVFGPLSLEHPEDLYCRSRRHPVCGSVELF